MALVFILSVVSSRSLYSLLCVQLYHLKSVLTCLRKFIILGYQCWYSTVDFSRKPTFTFTDNFGIGSWCCLINSCHPSSWSDYHLEVWPNPLNSFIEFLGYKNLFFPYTSLPNNLELGFDNHKLLIYWDLEQGPSPL